MSGMKGDVCDEYLTSIKVDNALQHTHSAFMGHVQAVSALQEKIYTSEYLLSLRDISPISACVLVPNYMCTVRKL